jgi:hypothetical protein
MERSHIPLSKWVLAAQLMASSKKSMSAHQLHRMLGTNYETAWFLFHRLREAANDITDAAPIGGENKVVEADESYIGGKARNKAFGPPPKKMAVFNLVEREGHARSQHVADVTAKSLREAIVTNASRESYLMTDEALVYERLGKEFAGHGHLHRYLAEADFKYNHRAALGINDAERAAALLRGAKGKRLLYRQPDSAAHA